MMPGFEFSAYMKTDFLGIFFSPNNIPNNFFSLGNFVFK